MNKIVNKKLSGKCGNSIQVSREKEREFRIALTAITAIIAKISSMMIPLITVRYSLSYLGGEVFGLWNTIISFFAIFAFADLGLGSGLQTALSKAQGKDDEYESQKLISSTFIILFISTIISLLLFVAIIPIVDWSKFLNVKTEATITIVSSIVFIIVSSKLLNIPLSLVTRTQLALQEGYRGNLWQCTANFISLLAIIIIVKYDLGSLTLIAVSSFVVVVISLLNYIIYFGVQRRNYLPRIKYVDSKTIWTLLKVGISFLCLSVLTSLGLSLDEFIVAKTTSLENVAVYSILNKATHLISVGCGMLSAPLWGAFGEALSRNETYWVKSTSRKICLISIGISLSATVLLLSFGRYFFKLWLGSTIIYDNLMMIGMCVMQCMLSIISPYFMILNAKGIVKQQIFVFSLYTVISTVLKFAGGYLIGVYIIPCIGAVCYGLIVIPTIFHIAKKQIK